ncbi:MAG: DUF4097 family beta strand repeat-containing protein [Bacteroidota bacterium]
MDLKSVTLGVLGIGLCLVPQLLQAQKATETIRRAYTPKPEATLYLRNINGSVEVEGYNGTEVQLVVKVSADEEAQREISLGEYTEGKDIVLYLDAEWLNFNPRKPQNGYQWDQGEHPNPEFQYDFTLKVPRTLSVDVGTIQLGDVLVKNIQANVYAYNINGDVALENIGGTGGKAHTINGDIDAIYTTVPDDPVDFHTINGTINVTYPSSLAAAMTFESFNGNFYTDFDYELLPVKMTSNEEHGNATTYRLESLTSIQVGRGGPTISFNNFNGNTYIRKR